MISTDYTSHAVVYSCDHIPILSWFGFKDVNLHILSRTMSLDDTTLQNALDLVSEQVPNYDMEWLKEIRQDSGCNYEGMLPDLSEE